MEMRAISKMRKEPSFDFRYYMQKISLRNVEISILVNISQILVIESPIRLTSVN